jgi:hypothetical protein
VEEAKGEVVWHAWRGGGGSMQGKSGERCNALCRQPPAAPKAGGRLCMYITPWATVQQKREMLAVAVVWNAHVEVRRCSRVSDAV